MDRRFFTWLMLTTAMCFLWLSFRPNVPPEPPAQQDAIADPLLGPQGDPLAPDLADNDSAENPSDSDSTAAEIGAPEDLDNDTPVLKKTTLGSMDPEKGYSLLLTFTSRGAALEHAELVARDSDGELLYRSLENKSGYLGHLSLEGNTITSVPDGSPAAKATSPGNPDGLVVNDRLLAIGENEVRSAREVAQALATTEPGDSVSLTIEREVDNETRRLVYETALAVAPLDVLRTQPSPSETVTGNFQRPGLRTTLASLNGMAVTAGQDAFPSLAATLNENWQTRELEVPGGQGVEFRMPLERYLGEHLPRKISLVKRFRLLPGEGSDGFLLDVETLIVNNNDEPIQSAMRQEGPTGLTLEGWWYSVKISPFMFSAAGQRDVVYYSEADYHQIKTTRQIQDHAKKHASEPDLVLLGASEPAGFRNLSYLGLDSVFFNASFIPHASNPSGLSDLSRAAAMAVADVEEIPKSKFQATNTSFWFDGKEKAIAANGGELSQRFNLFIGPKDTQTLTDHGLELTIEYGWFPWIAKPLGWILHMFYYVVGNYGLAIVMLTVLVRGLMFPLGRKAAANAQRMQELQPELKRINDQYKDNMEKRAKAMQELYAKHNFKPLAGCLPMFIQLPIFIGLYRCLSVDISLRQEPLIPGIEWCSNLAGPDMLFEWSSWMPEFIAGRGTGWLGPYFNILPIFTVVLFLVQQKMLMPKATDEQTRMTQNMMQVMTIFMGVLFFKVPSGLCIYFITSSLWSLVERRLVKKTLPASPGLSGQTTTNASASSESTSNTKGGSRKKKRDQREKVEPEKSRGRFDEIKQMLDKPAVKSTTQRGSNRPSRKKRKKR